MGNNRGVQRAKFLRILYLAKVPDIAIFPVPSNLTPFAQDTVDRLAYLFPEIMFSITDAGIECSSSTDLDQVSLTQEIRYGLARQKIRAEGQQERTALYAALFK
jgi:hypothetical protein